MLAMKHATEFVRGLRYKLRMMGIPVEEPAFVFGDNQSVCGKHYESRLHHQEENAQHCISLHS